MGSYCSWVRGRSYPVPVVWMPSVVKDLNVGRAFDPFAMRIESRIGLRRAGPPRDAVGLVSCIDRSSGGIGGSGARSFMLIGE